MSIKLMSQIWEKDLNHSQQSILLAMADFADDDGNRCYPSVARLAWKSGYSYRQTAEILKGLVGNGFVKIVKPATSRTQAEYKICASAMKDKPPFDPKIAKFGVEKISTLDDFRVEEISTLGGENFHPRVEEISTDPLVNHYLNISSSGQDETVAPTPSTTSPLQAETLKQESFYDRQTLDLMKAWSKDKPTKKVPSVRMSAEQAMIVSSSALVDGPVNVQPAGKLPPRVDGKLRFTILNEQIEIDHSEFNGMRNILLVNAGLKQLADMGDKFTVKNAEDATKRICGLSKDYRSMDALNKSIAEWKRLNPGKAFGIAWFVEYLCKALNGNVYIPVSQRPSTPTAPAAVGASVYKASPELER